MKNFTKDLSVKSLGSSVIVKYLSIVQVDIISLII